MRVICSKYATQATVLEHRVVQPLVLLKNLMQVLISQYEKYAALATTIEHTSYGRGSIGGELIAEYEIRECLAFLLAPRKCKCHKGSNQERRDQRLAVV